MSDIPRQRTHINWEDTDPVSGISKGSRAAYDLIDTLNYDQLRMFNRLVQEHPHLTHGEYVELYFEATGQDIPGYDALCEPKPQP